jgi:hypothetical protein
MCSEAASITKKSSKEPKVSLAKPFLRNDTFALQMYAKIAFL